MNNLLSGIFKTLDITTENGLATTASISSMTSFQRLFFTQVKEKIGIDAVYFLRDSEGVAKIPLIYFRALDKYDAEKVAELHRLSWNMGEAPLLFIVTQDELKVFNNYESPRRKNGTLDPEAGLIDTISLLTDLETQRRNMLQYNRSLLESGDYWRTSKVRFDTKSRVDTTLMSNLKTIRKALINQIKLRLTDEQIASIKVIQIVHGLLSRSILIQYLEERKDSNEQTVFPNGFYSQFSDGAQKYVDVLKSKDATYALFSCLEDKFNGDMFPLIENERDIITEDDLNTLRLFLTGDIVLENNQLVFWSLYSFDVIPIQLISSIYELFFHLSDMDDDEKGTYYTPLYLVDMLMDEVYSWDGEYAPITFMDPSCGSGIFLVEAYRRIVCRWMHTNKTSSITNAQLTKLLQESIFGVDINEEAVRVASFSLSLAMCDFLDPRSIWDQLTFPKLLRNNLTVSDFFSEDGTFNQHRFDIVIGNPPWQSQMTDLATQYRRKHKKTVGDMQIAQAFSLKSADLCKQTGTICLLMPSKGFLFNRSSKSALYRKDFFNNNKVSVIINFSAYRKFLFDHASGPAAGVIYSPVKPDGSQPIFYCTPKPLYTVEDLRKFSVEPNDICRIPFDIVHDDRIWKIAMWGGPRDLELIDRMQSTFLSLDSFIKKNNMRSAEGFKRGDRSTICDDFIGFPIVEAKPFIPFYVDSEKLTTIDYNSFERMSDKNREIFYAPHLIIKQSHRASRFLASVLDYDAVFNHSLLGIHGDVNLLKFLCLIVNSKLFSYYHLMTSRTWMVERDALEAGDIRLMPIVTPTATQLQNAVAIFDQIVISSDESKLNEFVYELYNLQPYEVLLVNDAIDYVYDYFSAKGKSIVFSRPSNEELVAYFTVLNEVLTNTLGKPVIHESHLFTGRSPLTALMLSLDGTFSDAPQLHTENAEIGKLLSDLDTMLTEKRQNVFVRRNVRIYGKDTIYIVKPTQAKYWNYSAACRDADEIFADIMKVWRGDNE